MVSGVSWHEFVEQFYPAQLLLHSPCELTILLEITQADTLCESAPPSPAAGSD